MIGIWANVVAVMVGTFLGWLIKRILTEKYIESLWIALGFATLGIGIETVAVNMPKSHYPVLFVVSLVIGLPLGNFFKLDERLTVWIGRHFKSQLGEAIVTVSFLNCIGVLAILGPVYAATKGDEVMLYTNAMFAFVSAVSFGAGFGLGMLMELPVVFIWFTTIYLIAKYLSANFFSPALVTEMAIVGGLLMVAAALSLLKIREFKTVNMLPALLIPLIFFIGLKFI